MERNKKLVIALPALLAVAIIVWLPDLRSFVLMVCGKKEGRDQGVISPEELSTLSRSLSSPKIVNDILEGWGERNPFDGEAVVSKPPDVKETAIKEKVVGDNVVDEKASPKKAVDIKAVKEGVDIEKSAEIYRLNGIFWNETKPSAIINGSVYYIGSKIGSVILKEIRTDEVVLFDGIKEDIVKLKQDGSN